MLLLPLLALLPCDAALAQVALPAVAIKTAADGAQTYSLTFQVLILMTVLTLLPAILLAMTAFTRIIIVLSILRQALGMATTPSNQILTGLALFMTFFVMSSTIEQSYANGIKPYLDGQLAGEVALDRTVQPPQEISCWRRPARTTRSSCSRSCPVRRVCHPGRRAAVGADPDLHDQRAENRLP